jgi:hypothetical protein
MPIPEFEFTHPLGHRDVNHYLQNPPSEEIWRDYLNEMPFEIRTYLKETVKAYLDDYLTHKAESASKHIKESGSNANGRYVKFDDGTMICTMTLDIAYTHPTVFYSQNKSYPATFITEPVLTISSYLDSTSNWDATRIITSAFRFSTNNTTICIPISLLNTANEQHKSIHNMITAIGRWKA